MYILNPESVKHKVKCKKMIAQYFINKDIPLLSQVGEYYYFAESDLFKSAYTESPFWVKWAISMGE